MCECADEKNTSSRYKFIYLRSELNINNNILFIKYILTPN